MAMPSGMFDDQMKELMDLLEQAQELSPEEAQDLPQKKDKEAMIQELMEGDQNEVLQGEQAAMAEFAIMMQQWEALVKDYEMREAQEKAEQEAEKGSVE